MKGSGPEVGDANTDQQVPEEALAHRGLRILHRPPPPPQQATGKEGEEPLYQEVRLNTPAGLEALRNHARPENIDLLFSVSEQ